MGSGSNLQMILLVFIAWAAKAHSSVKDFNVMNFGAVADGTTDNAKAFEEGWGEACSWKGESKFVIPRGNYLSTPVRLEGPCKGPTAFELQGVIITPTDLHTYDKWVFFSHIDQLTVAGGGTFDGQGAQAWKDNKCSKNSNCKLTIVSFLVPSIRFNYITNTIIENIISKDSKAFHINVLGCKNVTFQHVKISVLDTSVNTDGIHSGRSSSISIIDSEIGTGDDCISLGCGSNNVTVSNVTCGPGHGISIGSLGKYKDEEDVADIVIKNCTLTHTGNGIRIKTWPDSPKIGTASNFTFEDIVINNVNNPILIDQEYCPSNQCSHKAPSLIQIKKVQFKKIRGTTRTELALKLACSKGFPCEEVELSDIDLNYSKGEAKSTCSNVRPNFIGHVYPKPCSTVNSSVMQVLASFLYTSIFLLVFTRY